MVENDDSKKYFYFSHYVFYSNNKIITLELQVRADKKQTKRTDNFKDNLDYYKNGSRR